MAGAPGYFYRFKKLGKSVDEVWEFMWDWWDESYYTTCSQTDPSGPALGIRRGARGGSWSDGGTDARVSKRYNHQAGHTHGNVGLRLARTVP